MTDIVKIPQTENAIEIIRDGNGLFVSSLQIAENIQKEHSSVLKTIRKNIVHFEDFGGIRTEFLSFETSGGVQKKEHILLNEHQATLLMTFFRNSSENNIVIDFKKKLVKAFYAMRDKLSQVHQPKELSRIELAQLVLESEAELAKVTSELIEQKQVNDVFIENGKNTNLRESAKLLDFPPLKFNQLLEEKKYVYRSNGNIIPYQQHIHSGLFVVKVFNYTNSEGESKPSHQSFITPKGIDHLAKKLNVEIKK